MLVLLSIVGIVILWIAIAFALLRVVANLTGLSSVPPQLSAGDFTDVDGEREQHQGRRNAG